MARELQRGNRPHETGAAQKSRGANRQSGAEDNGSSRPTDLEKYIATKETCASKRVCNHACARARARVRACAYAVTRTECALWARFTVRLTVR